MIVPWLKLMTLYACIMFITWYFGYLSWWQALIIWNAISGITGLELDCASMPRYLNPNEEIDSHYPAFRRLDMKNWNKWRYYPGAATIMLPRAFLLFMQVILISIPIMIASIGYKVGKEPLSGWRKIAIINAYMLCGFLT